jgi:hypothetical protein
MRKLTSPELQNAIRKTIEFHRFAYDALSQLFATSVKTHLLLGYCNIAFEHYSAIAYLIDIDDHDSSARALIRRFVETIYRGLYVLYCATEEEIGRLAENDFAFPKFECIASKLGERLELEDRFKIPGELWGLFCGYTHSGFDQLVLQYGKDGSIESTQGPDQLMAILEHCALDISLISTSACAACERRDLYAQIASKRKELLPVSEA